jgi:hypothetical protein
MISIGCHITSAQSISAIDIHTSDVVNDLTSAGLTAPDFVNLINATNDGGADILRSYYVFSDFNTLQVRGTVASDTYLYDSVNALRALGLYSRASLVNPCVAGDEDILYSIKPG